MKPDLRKSHSDTENSNPTSIDVFTALSNEYRQQILTYLVHRSGPVAVNNLVDYIIGRKNILSSTDAESVLLELYHIHLPHLAAAGLITYDTTDEIVELCVNAADLRPFLDLTTATIRQQPGYH
jgi:hypothetical protein